MGIVWITPRYSFKLYGILSCMNKPMSQIRIYQTDRNKLVVLAKKERTTTAEIIKVAVRLFVK